MKLFKNKKTRRRNTLLLILPFFVIICICIVLIYKNTVQLASSLSGDNTDDMSVIESMDYHLRSNATEYQISLFSQLDAAVKDGTNEYQIADLVVKNFVADFYTWTNKTANYDIGGICYLFSHQKVNIYKQASDSYYKYLTYYINTYGSENLLEVEDIVTEYGEDKTEYSYSGKTFDAFYISANWTYKMNTKISVDDLVTKENFLVIYNTDNNRFEIVQAYGDK